MTGKARIRKATPPAGPREGRVNAVAAKFVAVLMVLYMLGVAGFFVYDQVL